MLSRTHSHYNPNDQNPSFATVLVPQGMEYQAVYQGIGINKSKFKIIAIPAGIQPLTNFLEQWQQSPNFLDKISQRLILMGLGGSLSLNYSVGDVILYKKCGLMDYSQESKGSCDQFLTNALFQQLGNMTIIGEGISSDRIICSAEEKLLLGKKYQADVVDMEGYALLNWSDKLNIPVAMIRVISDGCQQDLPDLTDAFMEDGSLQPLILARQMLKNPSNSIHLIRSSLKSLQVLQEVANTIGKMDNG
ncbi:purine phosphorylase [Crocosphaera sp.]|uniref:5'-methylthioadenosine/S-adenosylhomocysteine nucleosidase family protein n=1 Tax=Crocosphaera sp. TaxID=2729996 RepID=UPI002604E0D7|nr:purine phosphorylase [Crocosphaera sp.]MDJ0580729.1 purine phosphorylase [Crocosphaera sp.]